MLHLLRQLPAPDGSHLDRDALISCGGMPRAADDDDTATDEELNDLLPTAPLDWRTLGRLLMQSLLTFLVQSRTACKFPCA